jgi:hypothetical protein
VKTTVKMTVAFAVSLAISAVGLGTSVAAAQGNPGGVAGQRAREQEPCDLSDAVLDSARADVHDILFSNSRLIVELRHEQGIPDSPAQVTVSTVSDGSVCKRLASQLDHTLSASTKLAVLRVGSIFYARDPDQSRATGVFADSTLRVVMRLGAALDK